MATPRARTPTRLHACVPHAPAGRPTPYGRTGACRYAQSATTATPNVQHTATANRNARMNEPGMARGQALFPSEWLGRIRIWQWPLGRHSQQICRTAVFPFNHGDGDQSHFAGWFHTLIWLSQSKKKGGMIDARVSCEPRVKSWVMVLSLSETTAAQTQQCERYKVTDYSFTVRVK